ncbi:WSC-domain-containing protein [Ceratobasidium sp. AG-I]|nr:WSC-domain-containing protein [Ceratobasidium sp. AG-I]
MTRFPTSYYGAGAALVATLLSSQVQASADLYPPHRIAHRHIHSHVRRALPSGWSARGCVTDAPPPSRALEQSHNDAALTPAACIKSCAASGYTLAGTQFSKECWCGGALNSTGGAGENAAASACNMPCAGDASQTCGGNYHLNLYALSGSSSATPTSTSAYSTPSATGKSYAVKDRFAGKSFFNDWWFFNFTDPTNGQVDYLSQSDATDAGLAYVQSDGVAVMKVDNTSKLGSGEKRKSVRIHSNKQYNTGLFVVDILQMPFGCSVTFWTVGDNWPNNGEIDILENVNLSKNNRYTLHTGPNSTCTIDPAPAAKFKTSSTTMGKVCASKEGANAGCGFSDPDEASYGQGFNDAGGAVIAMEWQTSGIRIWRFGRNDIPADLQGDAKKPNPNTWGTPVAGWSSSSCNIANEVKKHNIIFDITLCGGWAGDQYAQSGCPGTCSDRVMEPSNFDNAIWKIKSLTVYE